LNEACNNLHVRWLLLLTIACGHPTSPPSAGSGTRVADAGVVLIDGAPLDQDLNRLAERAVVLYDDVLGAFSAAGEDCAVAAAKLEAIAKQHAEVIAANAKVLHDGRQVQLKLALRRFDERFQKAAQAIVQSKTIAACSQDPSFVRSLDQLVGPRPT
jgi:hypothetical protein